MRVLVACEESQEVCKAFREIGHEAYSCDIQDCSGGHPEWHIKDDALEVIKQQWDLIIAHPPCTYLTVTGNRWFNIERYGIKAIQRMKSRYDAVSFFMSFVNADCERIVIENPIGVMSSIYRKPDQIIQPWMFSHNEEEQTEKSTCLWLKGVKPLVPLVNEKPVIKYHVSVSGKRQTEWYYQTRCLPHKDRAKAASKTFPGIAKAMAEQWG